MVPKGITSTAGALLLHQTTTGLFRRYAHLAPDAALKLVDLLTEDDEEWNGEEL